MAGTGYRPGGLIELGIERLAPAPAPLPQLSTDEKLKALLSLFATLGGYGMTFLAILLGLLSAWIACNQYFLLSSWGRTEAEIASSEVYSDVLRTDTSAQTRPSPIFGFHCTVRFQASGRLYESQADIGYKKSAKTEMIDWYLRFPAGGHTAIAYDAADPSRIKLVEDFWTSYAAPLASLQYVGWLLLFGLPLVVISRRLRRQQQRSMDHYPEAQGCSDSVPA
jgi:Protein of unknown function (DUF3592)